MKRVLIVDDDELFLESLFRMFTSLQGEWIVMTALNGREALSKLAAQDCDVVLTDLVMPEKEGLETIEALRNSKPDLPVIAMSGGGRFGVELLPAAKLLGARCILQKPFAFEELVQRLREVTTIDRPLRPKP